jgi:hypothetical protein
MIDKIQFRRSSKRIREHFTEQLIYFNGKGICKTMTASSKCASRKILLLKKEIGILDPVQTEVHANDIIWK